MTDKWSEHAAIHPDIGIDFREGGTEQHGTKAEWVGNGGGKGRCKIRDAQVETREALKALISLRFPLSIYHFLGTFNHCNNGLALLNRDETRSEKPGKQKVVILTLEERNHI